MQHASYSCLNSHLNFFPENKEILYIEETFQQELVRNSACRFLLFDFPPNYHGKHEKEVFLNVKWHWNISRIFNDLEHIKTFVVNIIELLN